MGFLLFALGTFLIVVGAIAVVVLGVGFGVNESPWLAAASVLGGAALVALGMSLRARVRSSALESAAAARARTAWAMVDRARATDGRVEPGTPPAHVSGNLKSAIGMIFLGIGGLALLITLVPKDPDLPWSPTSIIVTVVAGVPGWLLLQSGKKGALATDVHERRARVRSVASRLDAPVREALMRLAAPLPPHQRTRLGLLLDYGHLVIEPWEAGIACSECGVEGPVRHVTFVKALPKTVLASAAGIRDVHVLSNVLCRPCIERVAEEYSGATRELSSIQGLDMNAAELFDSRNLPAPPEGARAPRLSPDVVEKLAPARDEIIARIESRMPAIGVYEKTAAESGCTPGEVALFVSGLASSEQP